MKGTQNFYDSTLYDMEKHMDNRVSETGSRIPYHLQFLRNQQKKKQEKEQSSYDDKKMQ